ncbi:MAG: hypothetical protein H6Q48_1376 [Deltaproteobacteria bacterium]|nr:hypothetical protein [Deltaproteobacteria bacterium]
MLVARLEIERWSRSQGQKVQSEGVFVQERFGQDRGKSETTFEI